MNTYKIKTSSFLQFLIFIFIIFELSICNGDTHNDKKAKFHYDKAKHLVENNKFEEALEEFNLVRKYNPKDVRICFDILAQTTISKKTATETIDILNIGIKYNPNFPEYYFLKGAALYELGRIEESIKSLDLAISHNIAFPLIYLCYLHKYNLLKELGRYEEARVIKSTIIDVIKKYNDQYGL